jgi:uncharacterized membrane protein
MAVARPVATARELAPPVAAGLLLGVGFGGFVDGILLHQVLQWHHMISATTAHPTTTLAGLEANTLADGLFHVLSWLFVVAGSVTMLRAWQEGRWAPPWRTQVGLVIAGWGTFDLVEGVIDHELLGVHHVRDDLGGPVGWDLGFLVLGLLLVVGGLLLARGGERAWRLARERG